MWGFRSDKFSSNLHNQNKSFNSKFILKSFQFSFLISGKIELKRSSKEIVKVTAISFCVHIILSKYDLR